MQQLQKRERIEQTTREARLGNLYYSVWLIHFGEDS
jgi:hypothetical protein